MLVGGLDEAGRGPVIGPLVIGYVGLDEKNLFYLDKIGVDDSKRISPKKRRELAKKIKENCVFSETLVVYAKDINEMHDNQKMNLNQIEVSSFAKLIDKISLKPDKIFLDACDTDEERFGRRIGKNISFLPKKIISKHKGDAIFKIVGAASIIAKTKRDEIIENYKKQYGDIGSGYPSDPKTRLYLENEYKNKRKFPKITRMFWKTTKNIAKKVEDAKKQRKITDY